LETQIEKGLDQRLTEKLEEDHRFRTETKQVVATMQTQLQELRYMVIEAPSYELDGVISSEALIRAIQRNSRRIDHLNELVLGLKEEDERARDTLLDMSECLSDIQLGVHRFVTEHNIVKSMFIDEIDHSFVNTEHVRVEIGMYHQSLEDLSDSIAKSVTKISNAFGDLYQILNRITTKAIPVFSGFDDELLQLRKLNELIATQREQRFDRPDILGRALIKRSNRTTQIGIDLTDGVREQLNQDFSLKLFQVPVHPTGDARKSMLFKPDGRRDTDGCARRAPSMVDIETKQCIADLQRKVEGLTQMVERIRTEIASQIENKADSAQIERMLEKVRSISNSTRDETLKLRKKMAEFLGKGDIEALVADLVGKRGGSVERGVVVVPQPRPGIACFSVKPVVPDLPNPHDQLFGGAKQSKR
jgi:hypothetical protein